MYIITLTLTDQKSKAPDFIAAHNAWIAQGFDDGVFVLVGGLKPQGGGAILAHANDITSIEKRVAADPFVTEGIATPHIQEVAPARADPRLSFLSDATP
ncbi:YciI family protein [uncultured Tateyamaria sp.]|uniref:YciI family protein n=1 Tax=Tateyamaria sp. 1078 TaxID=3417464 RepID=UPI0026160E4C|nr:YciI family protein [uncultured Tateyamaria sp.]